MSFFNKLNQFPFAYESQFSRVFGPNCISHSLEEPPTYNCAPPSLWYISVTFIPLWWHLRTGILSSSQSKW